MSDARSAIENTLYRYAWAYDMNELEDIDMCFTADAVVLFPDTGRVAGRAAVGAEMRRRRQKYDDGSVPWHVISNVYITCETESSARVRSWFAFFLQSSAGAQTFSNFGWYDDRFLLEQDQWRVHHRRILRPPVR